MQAPQSIHSGWFCVLSIFTSIPHAFVHWPHPIHLVFSTSMPVRDTLLKSEYIAPSGQIHLQKGLQNRMLSTTTVTRIMLLNVKSLPSAERIPALKSERGMAPSSTPWGQIYLQKKGSPIPIGFVTNIGSRITKTTRITYFR